MRTSTAFLIAGLCAPVFAQSYQRQANISGDGSRDQGTCTIEVVVDGSAEIQVRGTRAILKNTGGSAPQWRRFDCSAPMPLNPANFSFNGAGRGQTQLTRDPRDGGGDAVVRVDDPRGGSSTYVLSMQWQGYSDDRGPVGSGDSIFNPGGQSANAPNQAVSSNEAVELCQQQIMNQAMQRFGNNSVFFRRTTVNNNRGGQDRVRGTIDVDNRGVQERYRFNCDVNLNNGRVRSAQIENSPVNQNTRDFGYSGGNAANASRAIQACESAVDRRLAGQGYQRLFGSVDIDERTSSNRVFGSVSVSDAGRNQQTMDFACTVDFSTGAVSSVDVVPRR